MSRNRKLVRAIQKYYKNISASVIKLRKLFLLLLRTLLVAKRKRRSANAGFVLPTVAMVSIVVVLLTIAIVFRSFERSKNAANVRVNQVVLNATAPAIDRARAKLDALFDDKTLPRGTPSDSSLYEALLKDKYILGDEERLKLAFDYNNTSGIQSEETLKTAWRFGIDTDNNGKKDTFTLYGIYFRSPTTDASGQLGRRNPLHARTPPMDVGNTNSQCANAAGFSSLVGNSSWYKLNGNLSKSFFVYAVNVPITSSNKPTSNDYEEYKGNKGFTALELQQDRAKIPLANNAVWFENDLEITPGVDLAVNGRIHTNGNLLVGGDPNANPKPVITLRQVSSKTSCFFNRENGQVSVGGNLGTGDVGATDDRHEVYVDLYKGYNTDTTTVTIKGSNSIRSTNSPGGSQIGFNDAAFNRRIAKMKDVARGLCTTCQSATTGSALKTAVNSTASYPDEIKQTVASKVKDTDDGNTARNILFDEIEIYLRNRTRRVPFAEISDPTGAGADSGFTAFSYQLDPPTNWRVPLDSSNNLNLTTVALNTSQLEATSPDLQRTVDDRLGDRILAGNNLPAQWLDNNVNTSENNPYKGSSLDDKQFYGTNINWTEPNNQQRWRNTQIQALADLGISDRNGFWETNAYTMPTVNEADGAGGVRIITGAGIYRDSDGDLAKGVPNYPRDNTALLTTQPTLTTNLVTGNLGKYNGLDNIYVWPDTMPMSSIDPADTRKGDLLMRATAVYHYAIDSGVDQEPIACVSSYYDPTYLIDSKDSRNNATGLPGAGTGGKSNNGVVYQFPGRTTFNRALLERQARLVFPNGRVVNQPLRDALSKFAGNIIPSTLQAADYSAIDTALCSISILNNPTNFVAAGTTNMPPHLAIREASFLDGREAKQIAKLASTGANGTLGTGNDLDLEQRQPVEVRVTDIDLGQLARTQIATGEFLLPNSGIIYASRDDAMRDNSDTTAESELLSPTDFKLDPTRRPNGIRLINGTTLARTSTNTYNQREKGLILATNLPAYIRGPFNLHSTTVGGTEIEEFTQLQDGLFVNSNFYNRSTPNTNFACRPGRPGCPATGGDFWRPATVIADSMTLLSGSFRDGVRSESDFNLNNGTGIPVPNFKFNEATPINGTNLDPITRQRLKNGFLENGFVVNANWWRPTLPTDERDAIYPRNSGSGALGSYALNGITPIQRRAINLPLYVMEMCRKEVISDCTASDWSIGFDIDGDENLNTSSGSYTVGGSPLTLTESEIKSYQLGQAIAAAATSASPVPTDWNTSYGTGSKSIRQRLGAGDTATQALRPEHRLFPRRVAFARDGSNNLITTTSSSRSTYQPIGVGCPLRTTAYTVLTATPNAQETAQSLAEYRQNGCVYGGTTVGTNLGVTGTNESVLFFRTTNSTNNPSAIANATYDKGQPLFYYPPVDADGIGGADADGQPILVPVTQIIDAKSTPSPSTSLRGDNSSGLQTEFRDNWLNPVTANSTTFNATFVPGNSPGRPAEISAGLQNFVRFIEMWRFKTVKISGSFIQLKRAQFATAPFTPLTRANTVEWSANETTNLSVFNFKHDTYSTQNASGLAPFFWPPTRQWGFDVGLLSEQPDLFAQRFTSPKVGRPNEFFREVDRDDPWVKTLLCAGVASDGKGGPGATYSNAVPNEYRPVSYCPTSIPSEPSANP